MAQSFQQCLRDALSAATQAASFWAILGESTHDRAARAFLDSQSDRERAYAEAIGGYARRVIGSALPPYPDRHVELADVIPEWRTVDEISFDQAVEVASEAATHSELLYEALADAAGEPARSFLLSLAEQEDAREAQLSTLYRTGWLRRLFGTRRLAHAELAQRLRDAIAAEHAAARAHLSMALRARYPGARVLLEQIAHGERRIAEAYAELAVEHVERAVGLDPDPEATAIESLPATRGDEAVGLATALEHALLSRALGLHDCRAAVQLADGPLANALVRLAADQQEQMARAVYARTQLSVPTAEAQARGAPA